MLKAMRTGACRGQTGVGPRRSRFRAMASFIAGWRGQHSVSSRRGSVIMLEDKVCDGDIRVEGIVAEEGNHRGWRSRLASGPHPV
jgi:hypothetical protein